jgi:hypothetical protein
MRVKEYTVLADCVERGVNMGINRAYKHSDTPDTDYIIQQITDAVMLEISEYFDFDDNTTMEIDQ